MWTQNLRSGTHFQSALHTRFQTTTNSSRFSALPLFYQCRSRLPESACGFAFFLINAVLSLLTHAFPFLHYSYFSTLFSSAIAFLMHPMFFKKHSFPSQKHISCSLHTYILLSPHALFPSITPTATGSTNVVSLFVYNSHFYPLLH